MQHDVLKNFTWAIDPTRSVCVCVCVCVCVWGGGGGGGSLRAKYLLPGWFPSIWYATWPCSEKVEIWPYDPNPRVRGAIVGVYWQNNCYRVAAFMIPFNLICNMTTFWKTWILTYWPQPHGQGGGEMGRGLRAKYLLPCCCISDSLKFDMQHDRVLKKLNFDLLTPPLSPPRGWDTGLRSVITFDMFHIYCTSVCMWNFSKKYWQLTELLQNFNIWPLIPPKGSGGGVKF